MIVTLPYSGNYRIAASRYGDSAGNYSLSLVLSQRSTDSRRASLNVTADPGRIVISTRQGSGETRWIIRETNGVNVIFSERSWQVFGCSSTDSCSSGALRPTERAPIENRFGVFGYDTSTWHDYPGGGCSLGYRWIRVDMTFAGRDANQNWVSVTGSLYIQCVLFG